MPWDYSESTAPLKLPMPDSCRAREKNVRAAFLCGPPPVASAPIVNASRKVSVPPPSPR